MDVNAQCKHGVTSSYCLLCSGTTLAMSFSTNAESEKPNKNDLVNTFEKNRTETDFGMENIYPDISGNCYSCDR